MSLFISLVIVIFLIQLAPSFVELVNIGYNGVLDPQAVLVIIVFFIGQISGIIIGRMQERTK